VLSRENRERGDMGNLQDLLKRLGENLLAGQEDETRRLTEEALQAGALPQQILEQGMRPAMDDLGDRFSRGQAYLPELLLAAETMKAGMVVLEPAIIRDGAAPAATLLLGTVEGDIHDIGKNLVKMMCQGSGFRVVDLDTNVPAERFLEAYLREKPDLVGLSALLTSTMGEMEKVIRRIRAHDPQARFFVGGAPVRQEFADRIGADGYAPDAGAAVKVARRLVGK
jgi:5-methyltetrahydrofolate--homocysteine methyltransferase